MTPHEPSAREPTADRPGGHLPGQARRPRREDERRVPGDVGREPDPRFTLANERTFLAWNRTALALVTAGAAAAAFLDDLGLARLGLAALLVLAGIAVALGAHGRWVRVERAMRLGEPLPYPGAPRALGLVVALAAVLVGCLAVVDVLVR